MARVVCVHGIRQQFKGEEILRQQWSAALRDGLRLSGAAGRAAADGLADSDIRFAFYGSVFRPAGRTLEVGDPWLTAAELTEFEQELVLAWWVAAAEVDPGVIRPAARALARAPSTVQAALRALSGSAFFAGLAERVLLRDLVQVRRYFTEPDTRAVAQLQLADAVEKDTRVIAAHSLGSVVAYEGLCAHPDWQVNTLVTLGSPLGIRNLIFDRLQPTPPLPADGSGDPIGRWPGSVQAWTNVADDGDIVALVKDLRPRFGSALTCHVIHNGAKAHDIQPYLTAPQTGAAILSGL